MFVVIINWNDAETCIVYVAQVISQIDAEIGKTAPFFSLVYV